LHAGAQLNHNLTVGRMNVIFASSEILLMNCKKHLSEAVLYVLCEVLQSK